MVSRDCTPGVGRFAEYHEEQIDRAIAEQAPLSGQEEATPFSQLFPVPVSG